MNEVISLDTFDFIYRIGMAFFLGGAVGFERQWRQKSAGLRTNTLVSLGAAAYILLSVFINANGEGDPGRIAAQVVTGIGFLGAGVIMKDGFNIQGLNTAATIWCSAAVGCLSGMGMFTEACIVTSAIILTHLSLRPISNQLSKINSYKKAKKDEAFYLLTIHCEMSIEDEVRRFVISYLDVSDKYLLRSMSREASDSDPNATILVVQFSTVGKQEQMLELLISKLTLDLGVYKAKWKFLDQRPEY